jgi:magnesium chelatase family protein
MYTQIHTIAFRSIKTIAVTVQIHIANGLPAMVIVGLADKAVAESRERLGRHWPQSGLLCRQNRLRLIWHQPMF